MKIAVGHLSGRKAVRLPNIRSIGAANQAARWEGLSARIRFARTNSIFNFAVCFRRPRYRVFRYRSCPLSCPLTTANTRSTFALTDDFSCSLRLICACERPEFFLYLVSFPLQFLPSCSKSNFQLDTIPKVFLRHCRQTFPCYKKPHLLHC